LALKFSPSPVAVSRLCIQMHNVMHRDRQHLVCLNIWLPGESFYDWVVTISYYWMYQACLAALAAVRKMGENHSATVSALIYHYVHKKKRLNEQYLLSLDTIKSLADQDIQKLVVKPEIYSANSTGSPGTCRFLALIRILFFVSRVLSQGWCYGNSIYLAKNLSMVNVL